MTTNNDSNDSQTQRCDEKMENVKLSKPQTSCQTFKNQRTAKPRRSLVLDILTGDTPSCRGQRKEMSRMTNPFMRHPSLSSSSSLSMELLVISLTKTYLLFGLSVLLSCLFSYTLISIFTLLRVLNSAFISYYLSYDLSIGLHLPSNFTGRGGRHHLVPNFIRYLE